MDEGSDRAYTSFSGWLIGPTLSSDGSSKDDCCCPTINEIPTARPPVVPGPPGPPYPPPNFIGPPAPPVYRTSTKPTYILTEPPTTNVVGMLSPT